LCGNNTKTINNLRRRLHQVCPHDDNVRSKARRIENSSSISSPCCSSLSSGSGWTAWHEEEGALGPPLAEQSKLVKLSEEGEEEDVAKRGKRNHRRLMYHRLFRNILLVVCYLGASAAFHALLPPATTALSTALPQGESQTLLQKCLGFVLHLDKHLQAIIAQFGEGRTYLLLTGIVFCETGLVITPFLPGDSLLFACGAFAALGSLKLEVVVVTLCCAAIAGDAVNYLVGNWVGKKILSSGLISKKHVQKTEKFYEKHGGKTVVMARFVPIVRTFAPFVAGVGSMQFNVFTLYNISGAVIWTVSFTLLGYFFGNLPFVQKNFTLVVLGIVVISVLPVVYEVLTARDEN
jgi:membrane-associated protein